MKVYIATELELAWQEWMGDAVQGGVYTPGSDLEPRPQQAGPGVKQAKS